MSGPAGNKFWGGASSSESDSDSGSSDSEEERPVVAAAAPRKMARWAEASSSEDEGVAQRRVVRSHTDKKNEQMLEQIKVMKNHMKIDDFASTITDYEALLKMLEKLRSQVEADGGPPKQFVKAIGALEDYIEKTHTDIQEKKAKGNKLPENKAKAFNTLRSKVKKGNKPYTDDLTQLRAKPEDFQSEEEEVDSASEASQAAGSEDSGSDSSSSKSSSSSSDSSDSDSDSSDSSSDTGGSDSSDSDSESFDDSDKSGSEDGDEDLVRERKMLRWLITPEKLAEREKKAEAAKAKEAENKAKDQEKRARKKDKVEDGQKGASHQRKGKDEPEEYTSKELTTKVTEIAQQRGRRGFDRKVYMEKLQKLLVHAAKHGPLEQLYIYASMVSADFDNTGSAFAAMKIEMWNEALQKVNKMLPLLIESYNLMKNSSSEDKAAAGDTDVEDPKSHPRLQDLFLSFVEKLDDELYKALQFNSDVYGSEYHEILGNSSKCLVLLNRTLRYFEEVSEPQQLGSIAARLMEQLYYKPDTLNHRVYDAIPHTMPEESKAHWVWPDDSKAYMGKLCHYVWAAGDIRLRRRACLCQAYHLALHDCFQPARDLLHLGNFSEQAAESDVHTQILYNRVIAQIGLCAFRLGKIQEAHNCLMDVCQYNKGRELLAQGLSYAKNMERSHEQERAERQRQLPYHMHINLEVLESAQHICAMLLEVPNIAMQAIDPSNKRIISKVLRRALEAYDKQQYTGPPETAKDSVVAAAKDLQRGDWAKGQTPAPRVEGFASLGDACLRLAEAWCQEAEALNDQSRFKMAAEVYKRALTLPVLPTKRFAEIQGLRAKTFRRLAESKKVTSRQDDDGEEDPLVGMAAEWAIQEAEEALEKDPKCFLAAWEGAIAAKHIGWWNKGRQLAKKAMQAVPNGPQHRAERETASTLFLLMAEEEQEEKQRKVLEMQQAKEAAEPEVDAKEVEWARGVAIQLNEALKSEDFKRPHHQIWKLIGPGLKKKDADLLFSEIRQLVWEKWNPIAWQHGYRTSWDSMARKTFCARVVDVANAGVAEVKALVKEMEDRTCLEWPDIAEAVEKIKYDETWAYTKREDGTWGTWNGPTSL